MFLPTRTRTHCSSRGCLTKARREARADVDTLRASQGDNTLEVATASDVLVRALVLNGRAAHDETLALARRALRIKEALYGTERVELVPSLLNLCDVLTAAVDLNQAIAVARRAVNLSERSAGTDSVDVATALYHLGSALAAARRDDDALKVLERSVQLRERALNGTDVDIARTLEDLGLVLQRKGDYARSGTALRRARAIQEASNINHPAYVRTLTLLPTNSGSRAARSSHGMLRSGRSRSPSARCVLIILRWRCRSDSLLQR